MLTLHLILLSELLVIYDLFVCLSASASLFIVVGFLLFSACMALTRKSTNTRLLFSPLFLFSFFFIIQICFFGLLLPFVWTRIWSWSGINCCQLLIVNKLFRTHEEPPLATCASADRFCARFAA